VKIVARLTAATGDLEIAQDAVQEAFVAAMERWPADGVPVNPAGWIVTTARRRAIDQLRRDRRGAEKFALIAALERHEHVDDAAVDDDVLGLVFACCHPALNLESRVALTLRTVCGLSTAAIAKALLIGEAALAKRLVRTRARIRMAGIGYEVPPPERLEARLQAVLAVVYLLYTEGHSASEGTTLRRDALAEEAIRLGDLLHTLMPGEPEIMGLLALMRLNYARRHARVEDGRPVLLPDQDRSLWNADEIDAAVGLVHRAARLGGVGRYWLEAAIAAEHCIAPTPEATDWAAIVRLYDQLLDLTKSPVVAMNRAIAVAELQGLEFGRAALQPLRETLDSYLYFHATDAELARRCLDWAGADEAYGRALALTDNEVQRTALAERRSSLRHAANKPF
jgi:RNA polymerase sigma-70 factor, ECF subfamily